MKVTCCDRCGDVFNPNDRRSLRAFAGTSQSVALHRTDAAKKNSPNDAKLVEFEVKIEIVASYSPKRASIELDICPSCRWKAIEAIRDRDLQTPSGD